jgi:hypothetical protein
MLLSNLQNGKFGEFSKLRRNRSCECVVFEKPITQCNGYYSLIDLFSLKNREPSKWK